MIILNEVKNDLDTYLNKYDPKIKKKYLNEYLRFFSEEILENLYNKYRRKVYNKYLKYNVDKPIKVRDNEIFLENNHEDYPRVEGKYFGLKDRKWLYYQIKTDLQTLGYLYKTKYQYYSTDSEQKISSTKEIFKVQLPNNLDYELVTIDNEYGEWDQEGNDFWNDEYLIYYDDLINIKKYYPSITPVEIIKTYSQYQYLKRSGFKILRDTREDGTGYRLYHSFSFISEQLRGIIRDSDTKELYSSIDLVSSHLFFLANYTKNKQLYKDVKSRRIKRINKKTLLMWLNTQNYTAKKYKSINEYFKSIDLNTDSLRGKRGLYDILAKAEGNYVVRDISERFKHPNFTIHDQIYYLPSKSRDLKLIIQGLDSSFNFPPVWDTK